MPIHHTEEEQTLPIHDHAKSILSHISKQSFTAIHGETGCGKTTVIPRLLITDAEIENKTPRIIVCQPRRLACTAISERVRMQIKRYPEYTVGHRIMNDVDDNNSASSILFVTTGYLVQWLSRDPEQILSKCTHAHERSVDMDLLALMIRRVIIAGTCNFKLVIMSATLDVNVFAEYFASAYNEFADTKDDLLSSFRKMNLVKKKRVLHVGVKRFDIKHVFLEDLIVDPNFLPLVERNGARALEFARNQQAAFESFARASQKASHGKPFKAFMKPAIEPSGYILGVLLALHFQGIHLESGNSPFTSNEGGCVMVFLPGENEILEFKDTFESVLERHASVRRAVKILVLHSSVPPADQKEAFIPALPGTLKIILCTNIAESSLTIPDSQMVIDYGLQRTMQYDSRRGLQTLTLGWISKASATQRKGRCGRTCPGVCVAMYTREFNKLQRDHAMPEIAQVSLEGIVLRVKDIFENENVRDVFMELVEPPEELQLDQAFLKLRANAAIADYAGEDGSEDGVITFFGRLASCMPCELVQSRVLLFAQACGIACEGVIMAAALVSSDVFSMPSGVFLERSDLEKKLASSFAGRLKADNGHASDPIALVKLFKEFSELKGSEHENYCMKNAIHSLRFRQFRLLVSTLAKRAIEFTNRESRESHGHDAKGHIAQLWDLISVAQRSFRDEHVKHSDLFCKDEDVIDRMRMVLAMACSNQKAIGRVRDNQIYTAGLVKVNKEIQNLASTPKKGKKKAKKAAREQIAAQLFCDSNIQPVPRTTNNFLLSIFRETIPDRSSSIKRIIPGLGPAHDESKFSSHPDIPADQIYRPFIMHNTILVKLQKNNDNPSVISRADVLRKKTAWMGVVRVWISSATAAFEFESVESKIFVDLHNTRVDDDGIDDISYCNKFVNHLATGRNLFILPKENVDASADVSKDHIVIGTLIMPRVIKWSCNFLQESAGLKFYWRSPINNVYPINENQICAVAASTMALSNGQSFAISLSGVTLIPHHKVQFQRLLIASSASGSLACSLTGPDTITSISVDNLEITRPMTRKDLHKINDIRVSMNDLVLYGAGFDTCALSPLLFELPNEESVMPPKRFSEKFCLLNEEVDDGEEFKIVDGVEDDFLLNPVYRAFMWPDFEIFEDEGQDLESSDEKDDSCSEDSIGDSGDSDDSNSDFNRYEF